MDLIAHPDDHTYMPVCFTEYAHITGGSWHYDKGADPCQLVRDEDNMGCP